MTIYNIKNDYIQFLRTFDTKIEENKNEKRPYVGIVLQIGSIEYYAPLTSPKPKHKNMKNSKDFRKIENGKYRLYLFTYLTEIFLVRLLNFHVNMLFLSF